MTRQNREAQLRLASEKHRLDTALNNMTQGLVLYDASARVVISNQRYLDMYNLSTDVVKPGCSFFDLIQHRKDTGSFNGDVEEFCSNILRNVAAGKITRSVMESRRRSCVSDRQQAAGAGRMGRHDRGHHGATEPRTGTRPQLRIPAPDHRPHPDTDHREGRARPPLCAGQPGGRDPIRPVAATTSSARPHSELFPKPLAEQIAADDDMSLQFPDGLFARRAPLGKRSIGQPLHHLEAHRNSGIRPASPATSSTSSKTSPSAAAPTRRSRIWRITTR